MFFPLASYRANNGFFHEGDEDKRVGKTYARDAKKKKENVRKNMKQKKILLFCKFEDIKGVLDE